jgi:hypothetical protein
MLELPPDSAHGRLRAFSYWEAPCLIGVLRQGTKINQAGEKELRVQSLDTEKQSSVLECIVMMFYER